MKKRFLLFWLIGASLLMLYPSCRTRSGAQKATDRIEATKDEKAREVQKQYDAAVKRHQKIQGKEGRKRQKKLQKKSEEYNKKVRRKVVRTCGGGS